LAGPTAVGKTDVAIAVAERFGGEIIGADAFQVYQSLDLLTAKPSAVERGRVPHYLVGSVPLTEPYSVAVYREQALAAIAAVLGRGRLPIIVGGTGLYLRALIRGLSDAPPGDASLRDDLARTPLSDLVARLASIDPEASAQVDLNNPRRVIRALEVALLTGKPFSSFRQEWGHLPKIHAVFLEREREELYARIHRRTEAMFRAGVLDEVRAVMEKGGVSATAEQVIGWREIQALLAGALSEAECISAIQQATRRYAKRQMTWFKREPIFEVVSLTSSLDISLKLPSLSAPQIPELILRLADSLVSSSR
jgi:tRNA dimethylallyltransferase